MILVLFSISVFLSAALLFLVEPMVAKMLLPLLGGSPAVWNTCLVFFQAILLAGYAYAHAATKWFKWRVLLSIQCALILLPAADRRSSAASAAWLDAPDTSEPNSLDFVGPRRLYRHPLLRALLLHAHAAAVVRHIEKHPGEGSLFSLCSE